jgi:nucleoside phosphorylase
VGPENDRVDEGWLPVEDLARHIITFDPRVASSYRFAEPEAVDNFHAAPVSFPDGLAPTPTKSTVPPGSPMPKADVLVVTYTVAEGYALADMLAPGWPDSGWTKYQHNWATIKKLVGPDGPSRESDDAAVWALTMIGSKRVVIVKSSLHPATDGIKLPIRVLWKQMIEEVQPSLVITTGTAGAVTADVLLGDVVISRHVQWDATKTFAKSPFAHEVFPTEAKLPRTEFRDLPKLIAVNASRIPPASRAPQIVDGDVLTTDFFAFDDVRDSYRLRAYNARARAVEMDDAALGLAIQDFGDGAPAWVSIRNASDPQMNEPTLADENSAAGKIYEKYGYWTAINSVLACWALIASLPAQDT